MYFKRVTMLNTEYGQLAFSGRLELTHNSIGSVLVTIKKLKLCRKSFEYFKI